VVGEALKALALARGEAADSHARYRLRDGGLARVEGVGDRHQRRPSPGPIFCSMAALRLEGVGDYRHQRRSAPRAVFRGVEALAAQGVGDDQAVGGVDVCSWRSVSTCAVASSAERRAEGRDQRAI